MSAGTISKQNQSGGDFVEQANGFQAQMVAFGDSGNNVVAPGATSLAVGQVTTSTSAATLVVARPTRRGVTIRNQDTSISVYIGPATVTSGNGLLLKAGESIYVSWVGLIQVIAASGTPAVATWDEYS